jgi:putative N6-adenine-specific DNA methylase
VEHLFVGATPGLEHALGEELAGLGFSGELVNGGVELAGPVGSFWRINLWSRLASRVLLRVAEVASVSALKSLDLSAYGREFELDAFGEDPGTWGVALPSKPGAAVNLNLRGLKRGRCQVSVDTSGELLHFRGYRQEVGRAPLRETLAAGLLQLAKWQPGEVLWDVMCGSGTILIEGAERAAGLAPGRNRRFAFEHFPSHDEAAWKALPRSVAPTKTVLLGSDLNSGALGTARRNAKRAGVFELLTLERLDATKLPVRPERGLVIANLPYGKRVGERDELGTLYRKFGGALRKSCAGWYFALLLEEGVEHLGLEIQETHRVSNGGLDCQLVLGEL